MSALYIITQGLIIGGSIDGMRGSGIGKIGGRLGFGGAAGDRTGGATGFPSGPQPLPAMHSLTQFQN